MKTAALLLAPLALAFDIQFDNKDSVKTALKTISTDMLSYYKGDEPGGVPGYLPGAQQCNPAIDGVYCWWLSGAMFGSLINYWQYTEDDSNNRIIAEAIQYQRGPDENFNPPNQSRSMGIDDQGFWAFTALDAVEANFPESTVEGDPSWLALAQGLFNFQVDYWDTQTCGGGFRWQVLTINAGYNLKNMISNGGNFQLAARLAYITGNSTYGDWAEMVWEWMEASVMFEHTDDGLLYIWDNTDADNNCTDATHFIWTYNYGVLLAGAAYMYNTTGGSDLWKGRVDMILDSTLRLFFPATYGGEIMVEYLCEEKLICNQDQKSFKAYLARWMAVTAVLVPSTYDQIHPKLVRSASGAAGQCDGGETGKLCGAQWYTTVYTGETGVGEQMAALSVIGSTLIDNTMIPKALDSGATSTSDPNAGTDDTVTTPSFKPITTADKAGAAILTILFCIGVMGAVVWLVL